MAAKDRVFLRASLRKNSFTSGAMRATVSIRASPWSSTLSPELPTCKARYPASKGASPRRRLLANHETRTLKNASSVLLLAVGPELPFNTVSDESPLDAVGLSSTTLDIVGMSAVEPVDISFDDPATLSRRQANPEKTFDAILTGNAP